MSDTLLLLFYTPLRPHNPPPKELTNNPKPISRPAQLPPEQIMLIRRLHLSLANRLDGGILRRANRALRIFVDVIQTALVEGMFAQEVDGGEIQAAAAGHAPARLEDDRGGAELANFLFLGFSLGGVTGY